MNQLRIVTFEEAGEDVVLYFKNSDVRRLLSNHGKSYQEIVISSLLGLDLEIMDECLKVGAKKDEKPFKVTMDDLDGYPMSNIQEKLLDAFSLCTNGRTYLENMKYLEEEFARRQEEGEDGDQSPPKSPEASSNGSGEPPSGQE